MSQEKASLKEINRGIPENDVRYIRPDGYNAGQIRGIVRSYELRQKSCKKAGCKCQN